MKAGFRHWISALCLACCPLAFAAGAPDPVSLVFAGDIVLDDSAGEMIERGQDPFAGLAAVFGGADIRIGNLECVIATTGSAGDKNYTFRAHPRTLPVLKRHFDALALANNHSGDFGREAFAQMLGLLKQSGLAQFGGGIDLSQAHTPLIIERKGLRIALLGYSEFMPRSFEADYNAPGIAWSEDEQVVADIRKARTVYKADLVIPVMHWGWENEPTSNARQRHLARLMIDAGADVVIGGHPHVTQEIEHYQGKPIIYSVGNFVMKETDNANQRRGWVLRLQLDKQGVSSFDTVVVQISLEGIPQPDRDAASPCWSRGDTGLRLCRNPD
ncbi:CapA family protein [Polaromonas naphthalenivorans]|uniref:Putative poly-gamma-glutamate biosynthesis enzyme n=1 Tax=Polaromonas naphthalenivorans (strain CJ2) TaxID=365044 RepID=A1VPY5_POLNA|nr:CapA family protein [Polaromonas naphthalenivorans]ABM37713.1 putative poly-gamma-glutamate biosynthesis enzyme [Polaromonas naphthalenivorans CJ2]